MPPTHLKRCTFPGLFILQKMVFPIDSASALVEVHFRVAVAFYIHRAF